MNRTFPRHGFFEFFAYVRASAIGAKIFLPVTLRITNEVFGSGMKQAHRIQHARQCPDRKSTATEAKQINLIAGFVGIHQEAVSNLDVLHETAPKGESLDHGPALCQMSRIPWFGHGANTAVVECHLLGGLFGNLVSSDDIGVVAGKLVVCAITAKNNVF